MARITSGERTRTRRSRTRLRFVSPTLTDSPSLSFLRLESRGRRRRGEPCGGRMAHVSSLPRRGRESSLPQNESKAMHAPDPTTRRERATTAAAAAAGTDDDHGVAFVRPFVHEEAGLASYVRPDGGGGGVGGRNGSHAARRAGGPSDRRHSGSLPGWRDGPRTADASGAADTHAPAAVISLG